MCSLTASADGVDPLCGNMKGWERFNPLAKNPLALLTKCIVVYCDPKLTGPNPKDNLKLMDTKLGDLLVITGQANGSYQKFLRACRALNNDFTQTGPKMDAFQTASAELGYSKLKLSNQYNDLQKYPLADTFSDTSASMLNDYHQPDCMKQINQITIDELNAAGKLLDTAQIDCGPAK